MGKCPVCLAIESKNPFEVLVDSLASAVPMCDAHDKHARRELQRINAHIMRKMAKIRASRSDEENDRRDTYWRNFLDKM